MVHTSSFYLKAPDVDMLLAFLSKRKHDMFDIITIHRACKPRALHTFEYTLLVTYDINTKVNNANNAWLFDWWIELIIKGFRIKCIS